MPDNLVLSFDSFLQEQLKGRKVLLLGFGREGRSSWDYLRRLPHPVHLGIADRACSREELPVDAEVHTGEAYLQQAGQFDLCLCSPGIPRHIVRALPETMEVTSQTDLFLRHFHSRSLGITGTKGKSTTSTLVSMMLRKSGIPALLAGNIGIPPFEAVLQGTEQSLFVLELSAHQLAGIRRAPHIACLLNLFEEHLDHFHDLEEYFQSKWRIALLQGTGDHLVIPGGDTAMERLRSEFPPPSVVHHFSGPLFRGRTNVDLTSVLLEDRDITLEMDLRHAPAFPGLHQRRNAVAAAMMAALAGARQEGIQQAVEEFHGLPHRLEYLGEWKGLHYYNDAIATIPEAVMEAIRSLGRVDTLILGGMDRGISYDGLAAFLGDVVPGLVLGSGPAGKRIIGLLRDKGYPGEVQWFARFGEAVD
ncbi:MAG TPA: UDP-N-acetylmuramoyl-L-alanine--D-glutamate ligase, partial [Bacteroidales bacterium]|nr:UDP-N-acetylmuramoyl-L-alanine--D-glutamate ligase [Bacteroidales bacterium]